MQATQHFTVQAEITFETVLQLINSLPLQDKLRLEKNLKQQVLREHLEHFIASAPEHVPLTEEDIMAEVKAVRNAKHGAV